MNGHIAPESQAVPASNPRVSRLTNLGARTLLVAGLIGCSSTPDAHEDHWNTRSVGPRAFYAATGYKADRDGSYKDFQYEQKRSINLTMRKHALNLDPSNPFQKAPKSYMQERPPHSLLPDPLNYFHLTSLVVGGALSATSFGFVPIPIDSLLGTIESGGPGEFTTGLFGGEKRVSRHTRHVPDDVDEFELKHPSAPAYVELN
jgi:hypothetical protein